MRKRIIPVLLAFLLTLSLLPVGAQADNQRYGPFTYQELSDGVYIIMCDSNVSGTLTVPESIGGRKVLGCGMGTFYYLQNVTKIVLPDTFGFFYLADGANPFYGCEKLQSVEISKNNPKLCMVDNLVVSKDSNGNFDTLIGGIPSELVGEVVVPRVTHIGGCAFMGCNSITSIVIPNSVTSLGWFPFLETSVNTLYLPNTISGYVTLGGDDRLTDICYGGTKAQWDNLNFGYEDKESIKKKTIHYYSWTKGKDPWKIENTNDETNGFETVQRGYFITLADYEKLTQNLHPYDLYHQINLKRTAAGIASRYNVDGKLQYHFNPWGGSCFGLSSWATLVKDGVLDLSLLKQPSASSLHDVTRTDHVNSAVNFYQGQSQLVTWQNLAQEFASKTQVEQLLELETLIQKNAPVLLVFAWNAKNGADVISGCHAVVAYAMEPGSFTQTITKIDGKKEKVVCDRHVSIYDCTYPENPSCDLYYRVDPSGESVWCIPAYNIISKTNDSYDGLNGTPTDDNGLLAYFCADTELLNAVSYVDGSISERVMQSELKSARLYASTEDCYTVVVNGQTSEIDGARYTKTVDGLFIRMEAMDAQDAAADTTVFLPDSASYDVKSENALSIGFGANNCVAYVETEQPGAVTFTPKGDLSVQTEKSGEIRVQLVNGRTEGDWDCVILTADSSSEINVRYHENQVVFSGEGLASAEVTAYNRLKEVDAGVSEKNGTITVERAVEMPFTDVPANAYYAQPVLWAVGNNITNGTSPTTFSPDAACTRGQMVTFLWRAKGCPEPKTKTSPFSDVKGDEYYGKAVLWAAENGIAQGMGGGRFAPDATVTRGQTVTFLWRMEGQPKAAGSNPFRDVPTSEYYYQPVLWAVAHQITNGTTASTFSPNEPCTRAQIVTFLYRDLA